MQKKTTNKEKWLRRRIMRPRGRKEGWKWIEVEKEQKESFIKDLEVQIYLIYYTHWYLPLVKVYSVSPFLLCHHPSGMVNPHLDYEEVHQFLLYQRERIVTSQSLLFEFALTLSELTQTFFLTGLFECKFYWGVVNLTPLQILAIEGPISIKMGTDIERHVRGIAVIFPTKRAYFNLIL